jgi:hypothetical protein
LTVKPPIVNVPLKKGDSIAIPKSAQKYDLIAYGRTIASVWNDIDTDRVEVTGGATVGKGAGPISITIRLVE